MERASYTNELVLLAIDSLPPRLPGASLLERMAGALLIAMSLVYGSPSSVSAQT